MPHIERWITSNPAERVRRSRAHHSEGDGMDPDGLGRFLYTAARMAGENAALAVPFGLNALRVSEACAANVEDRGFKRGHRPPRIVGKGDKPAMISLVPAHLNHRPGRRRPPLVTSAPILAALTPPGAFSPVPHDRTAYDVVLVPDPRYVLWPTCSAVKGCCGVQLWDDGPCLGHLDPKDRELALSILRAGALADAGRGVTFTRELLEAVLAASANTLRDACFLQATFEGDAKFAWVTFEGDAWFDGATFTGVAWFDEARFEGDARFSRATFKHDARFGNARFKGDAYFDEATFDRSGWFGGARFTGDARFKPRATFTGEAGFEGAEFISAARFNEAEFTSAARFDRARFVESAWFYRAKFAGEYASFNQAVFRQGAVFEEATFQRQASFEVARFNDDAQFNGSRFEGARQFGPVLVRKSLVLDDAVFRNRAAIKVSAAVLRCERARFLAGAQFLVRWAQVILDGADLAAPSILSREPAPFPHLDEGGWPPGLQPPRTTDTAGEPRLMSVRRADVAGLTVAQVDVRACRFVDAHHLDQLRIEESDFASTPSGWRWTARQTIAEEHDWRANRHDAPDQEPDDYQEAQPDGDEGVGNAHLRSGRASRDDGWYTSALQPPAWLDVEWLHPAQIAAIYRDLRKGREDHKDEPGAADLYYGEMEMRRCTKRDQIGKERRRGHRRTAVAATTEYAILWLYWLVSGYGLRAWRALAALAAVVLLASGIFAFWGFAVPDQSTLRPVDVNAEGAVIYERHQIRRPAGLDELPTALQFSAQATTALLRGLDAHPLTAVGEWLQIALRLVGPVLLGLAVLSVRGRVKR